MDINASTPTPVIIVGSDFMSNTARITSDDLGTNTSIVLAGNGGAIRCIGGEYGNICLAKLPCHIVILPCHIALPSAAPHLLTSLETKTRSCFPHETMNTHHGMFVVFWESSGGTQVASGILHLAWSLPCSVACSEICISSSVINQHYNSAASSVCLAWESPVT